MDVATEAAREINALWEECLGVKTVGLANCPGDEQIAAIIKKYMAQNDTPANDKKGGQR